MMFPDNIKNKLNQLPTDPGVYHFYNDQQKIIYIGKAKNLKNRVKSYFQNKNSLSPKNATMLKHIKNIDWIIVRNEVEALMTEANLIKMHHPKYNIDLRDDKSYPFIRITNEPYPQVFLTRNIIKDGSKYFGPFTDVRHLRRTLKALQKAFPIRSCNYFIDSSVIKEKKISICLDYHIKKCEGPCEGLVSREKYSDMVNRIEDFMKGKTKPTEEHIKKLMIAASNNQNYEEAKIYRDQLESIFEFKKKQSLVATDFVERDVIVLSKEDDFGIAVILRIRNGRIFSRDKLSFKKLDINDGVNIRTIIMTFYLDSDFIPRELSLQVKPQYEKDLLDWLRQKRGRAVRFIYPQKGEKAKEIRITLQNAKLLLGEWKINKEKRKDQVPKILNQLKDDLSLTVPPKKIEAFDISHLGGTNTVASMVSFVDALPKKKEYRKYNIKSVADIDDFASIKEVVHRRYKRLIKENIRLPDLILIDGGKGQLNMALSALEDLGVGYIPIIGLAKRLEEVFIPGNSEPQSIHKQSPGLILLRRIRDEAHRFAISFQRSKRKKTVLDSVFSNISGLGVKRIRILMMAFDGPKNLAVQDEKIINEKTGIPIKICSEIIKVSKEIIK
jgi:excinuclease ABC subunit C